MEDEWKKLQRELKILRAKQSAGGRLHPKDQARLQWLEERLGDAEAVLRHQIEEPVDAGPRVTTSDDHYATEISEQLLRQAEKQKLTKAWEQENLDRQKKAIEVSDTRRGKATFRQQGLSSFAVEVTEDLKEGEVGLAEVPQEEQEAAQKLDFHKAVYAQDESERLIKKPEKSTNPFALDVADSLARSLDRTAQAESLVPDTGAKSFGVDVDDEQLRESPTSSYEQIDPDAEKLLRQLGMSPGELNDDDSLGAKTTHRAEAHVEEKLDEDLLRQAVDYAEQQGLVEEQHVWATDDEGREIELKPEADDLVGAALAPQAPLPKSSARWSDEKPTVPGVVEDPDDTAADLLAAAVQAEAQLGRPSHHDSAKAATSGSGTGSTAPAVLVPDPPDLSSEEDEGPLLPEPPPEPPPPAAAAGPPAVIALGAGDEEEETEIFDVDESMIEAFDASSVPDLSEGGEEASELSVAAPEESTGEAVSADDFWGLSGADTESTPAEDVQATAKQPAPAPPQPEPAGPLPALSAVPVPAAPSRPRRVAPKATKAPRQTARQETPQSLLNLFDEPATDSSDGMVPVGGGLDTLFNEPVRQPSQRRGVANDLTGPRRATVHFKDGVNRRGIIGHIDTDADLVRLEPAPGSGGAPEDIVALAVKAIFLMLPRGTAYPEKQGQAVRLVMMDGRKLEGFTPDYDPHRKAFTLFPARDSGNIERVIVYNDAVKNIWFE